jgi:hypothetical protein
MEIFALDVGVARQVAQFRDGLVVEQISLLR